MAELQITQEYLGHSNHLVYLAPMWKEILDADTFAAGPGSTVARVVDGTLEAETAHRHRRRGQHRARSQLDRPRLRAGELVRVGRLAWDPGPRRRRDRRRMDSHDLGPGARGGRRHQVDDAGIARSLVEYSMPLGLHHLIGGDHYEPMPENADPRRVDWSAIYYHRADATAIGFDRTRRGSNAVDQYRSPLREQWTDPKTTPEELLLWFHRLPWDYRLASGRTLWEDIVHHYTRGAAGARVRRSALGGLARPHVDAERYQAVLAKLQQQADDAAAWRDKCLKYFPAIQRTTIDRSTEH